MNRRNNGIIVAKAIRRMSGLVLLYIGLLFLYNTTHYLLEKRKKTDFLFCP